MSPEREQPLPPPDKKIPVSVMIIGSFEVAISLLGLMLLFLVAQLDLASTALFVLLIIYGAIGTGLLAIQEWARRANVILHIIAVPFILYTSLVLGGVSVWQPIVQLLISIAIVAALTRPAILYKFKTVVSKKKS